MRKTFSRFATSRRSEIRHFLHVACQVKANPSAYSQALKGKTLAMIFEKPSLRTRVTLRRRHRGAGRASAVSLAGRDQPGQAGVGARRRQEPGAHGAGHHDSHLRHEIVEEMAKYASVPVINGLTDYSHPCQAMADYLTMLEVKGRIAGLKVAYIGDGNNVAHSLMFAGAQLGADVWIATPPGYEPTQKPMAWAREALRPKPMRAAPSPTIRRWRPSMPTWFTPTCGPAWARRRRARRGAKIFAPYQVNAKLFGCAKPDAIFLHCLPAHRGDEVTDEVIDSPRSFVFQQAENRLHAQKAIMLELMSGPACRRARDSAASRCWSW